jgi:aminopeptidase N
VLLAQVEVPRDPGLSSEVQGRYYGIRSPNNVDNRLEQYDVKQYIIDLEVSPINTHIKGCGSVRAVVTDPAIDTFVLELSNNLQVDSVYFNGKKQPFLHEGNRVKIPVSNETRMEEHVVATLFYRGNPEGAGVFSGFNESYNKHVTWTLSEPFQSKEWFPCKQVLSDKADSARIILTTGEEYTAVSNGLVEKKENISGGRVTYHWVTRYPIAYYLLSFSVADFQQYNFHVNLHAADSVFIQNFVYDHPEYLNRWKKEIEATSDMMKLYSERLGTYPFIREKYGHTLMERGGGMEHQTITTLNNFDFLLVAHELTHQWFGDYVTCGSWQDIWINEGFASYGEYIALESLVSDSSADRWMARAHDYSLQNPDGSVYVPFSEASNVNRIFSFSLSYKKGAVLLHMIRYLIDDDEMFFSVLRSFLEKYRNDVATGDDFMIHLQSHTGMDFTEFFRQWYYGKGYPRYEVKWEQKADSVHFDFRQSASSDRPELFTTPVELKIESATGRDTIIRHKPDRIRQRFAVAYPHMVDSITVDPDNWLLNAPSQVSRVDMDKISKVSCLVYPNPTTGTLRVEIMGLRQMSKNVEVQDVAGKVLNTSTYRKNRFILNTGKLNPGVYLIEIRYNDSRIVRKFIKQ